jgi:hypothetical protein
MLPDKKTRGAASVLVIFFMLVLVTMGIFAIASSNANYRLSQRALSWHTMYYELDARGEEYVALIDRELSEAEARAREYVINKTGLPDDLKEAVEQSSDESTAFNRVFLYWAHILLEESFFFYPNINIYTFGSYPLINGLWIQFTFQSALPANENNFLYISVDVDPARFIEVSGGDLSVTWPGDRRYAISDWYEYQIVEPPSTGVAVWDGVFDFD